MKIAIPVDERTIESALRTLREFCTASMCTRIERRSLVKKWCKAPQHEPGMLPRWLKGLGANAIIAGGMGSRAQGLFAEEGIQVIVGAPQTNSP